MSWAGLVREGSQGRTGGESEQVLGLPGGPRGRAAGRERGAAAATVRGARQGAQQGRHAEVVSLTWEFAWSPSPPNKHNFVVNLAIYSNITRQHIFQNTNFNNHNTVRGTKFYKRAF